MTALVIGDEADGHVQAVLASMSKFGSPDVVVLDAPSLQRDGFSLTSDRLTYGDDVLSVDDPIGTGWLRRYAPTIWGRGSVVGSLETVTKGAFISLVGSILELARADGRHPLTKCWLQKTGWSNSKSLDHWTSVCRTRS